MSSSIRAIEAYLNQNDCTAMDLAAAFLKGRAGRFSGRTEDDLASDPYVWESERRGKGKKDKMVRLFLNVGKKQKVQEEEGEATMG